MGTLTYAVMANLYKLTCFEKYPHFHVKAQTASDKTLINNALHSHSQGRGRGRRQGHDNDKGKGRQKGKGDRQGKGKAKDGGETHPNAETKGKAEETQRKPTTPTLKPKRAKPKQKALDTTAIAATAASGATLAETAE